MNWVYRIIPHKDYNKELNMWLPTTPEFRIESRNSNVYLTVSDEQLMMAICSLLEEKKIELHEKKRKKCCTW